MQAVRLQDPGNRRATKAMPDVLQRPLDPRVTPRRVLLRHPDDELADLREDAATSRTRGVCPFPCDEQPMPAQNRVGRDDRRNLTRRRLPSRCPCTANRRRSSSVKRTRPRRCARRMRFSSTRYAAVSCRWSFHQPATAITKSRSAATSTAAGVYISDSGLVSEAPAEKWDSRRSKPRTEPTSHE